MVGVLIAAMIFSSIRADPESFNSSSCSLALCTYDPASFRFDCPSSKCSQIPEEINFESVKHLNLRNNEISSIEFKAEARGLEYLDLSNNSLKSISMGTFFPVDNLKVLKLSDNQLDQTVIEIEFSSGTFWSSCIWIATGSRR